MTKAMIAVLEKCFQYEVSSSPPPNYRETKASLRCIDERLIDAGLYTMRLNDGLPPMSYNAMMLTQKGRMLYCQHCGKEAQS